MLRRGMLVIAATLVVASSTARADWLDQCVAQWRQHIVSVSGAIGFEPMDFHGTPKNPRTFWVLTPGANDAVLQGKCQVTEVVVEGARPRACVKGHRFTARGPIVDQAVVIPGLQLHASTLSCQ